MRDTARHFRGVGMDEQSLTINDFSGGLTENFIPGQPNQYLAADNLILNPSGDGKAQLKTRMGSQVIDTTNARLPTADQRVSELINFDQDTELLAVSGTKLYHYAAGPTWTSILGPTTNNPFPAGVEATVHRAAQWKSHVFFVADSGDLPVKLYKNESGVFQLRTAGLPQVTNTANVSDATLLTNMIALAVELRTQMRAHYNDAGAADTNQHETAHTSAYDALNDSPAGSWVVPTTLATLITAVNLLATHHEAHIDDAQIIKVDSASADAQAYHWDYGYRKHANWAVNLAFSSDPYNSGHYPILNFNLNPKIATGTTLLTVRIKINDLRFRWNLHTYAIYTHGAAAAYGEHESAVAEVAYSVGPSISAQTDTILAQWAGSLMTQYHAHIADDVAHTKSGTALNVSGDVVNKWTVDPYSLETKLIVLGHLEHQFWQHSGDADYGDDGDTATYSKTVGDSTNGSRVITNVTIDPTTVYAVGDKFVRYSGQTAVNYLWHDETSLSPAPFTTGTAEIESMTAAPNSITLLAGQNATATYSQDTFIFSVSKYHTNPNQSASAVSYSQAAKAVLHDLDPDFSLAGIVSAYQAFRNKYYAHIQGRPTGWGVWPEADTTGSQYSTHFMSYIPANLDTSALYAGANDTLLGTTLSI